MLSPISKTELTCKPQCYDFAASDLTASCSLLPGLFRTDAGTASFIKLARRRPVLNVTPPVLPLLAVIVDRVALVALVPVVPAAPDAGAWAGARAGALKDADCTQRTTLTTCFNAQEQDMPPSAECVCHSAAGAVLTDMAALAPSLPAALNAGACANPGHALSRKQKTDKATSFGLCAEDSPFDAGGRK